MRPARIWGYLVDLKYRTGRKTPRSFMRGEAYASDDTLAVKILFQARKRSKAWILTFGRRRKCIALLGENGAGKSTLIKCLTGAYRRDHGEILLDGEAINPTSTAEAQALGIGTVYQEVNLLPNMTVAQNLTFGREPRRFGLIDGRAQSRQARALLAQYGHGDRCRPRPRRLPRWPFRQIVGDHPGGRAVGQGPHPRRAHRQP